MVPSPDPREYRGPSWLLSVLDNPYMHAAQDIVALHAYWRFKFFVPTLANQMSNDFEMFLLFFP